MYDHIIFFMKELRNLVDKIYIFTKRKGLIK